MSMHSLRYKRIAITRAAGQADKLVERLVELGAEVVRAPTIAMLPPQDLGPFDEALAHVSRYDWMVVTSANAVSAVMTRLAELSIGREACAALKVGAIGAATAAALEQAGLMPTLVPEQHTAKGLVSAIGSLANQRVLLPQADLARETLAAGLRDQGASVDVVTAYRTVAGPGAAILLPWLQRRSLDAIVFSSPSTLTYLLEGLEKQGVPQEQSIAQLRQLAIICIGPVTAQAARDRGLAVAAEAAQPSSDGIIEALMVSLGATERHLSSL